MGVYKILPRASLPPRLTVTYAQSSGPVVSLEADINGVPMLGGREVGEVFVAVVPRLGEAWLSNARAVLVANGWVPPDQHAAAVAEHQQAAINATAERDRAVEERDALARTLAIVQPDPEPVKPAARKPAKEATAA